MARYQTITQNPYANVDFLNRVATGQGALGSTRTTELPGGSPIAGAVGGGLAGAGVGSWLSQGGASLFGGTPTIAGLTGGAALLPYAAGGALLGGLLS